MITTELIDKIFDIKKKLINRSDILTCLNIAQKLAFKKDLENFKIYAYFNTTQGNLSYSYSALTIPCRKLYGVTNLTNEELLNINTNPLINDYGFDNNNYLTNNAPFASGTYDFFSKSFTFFNDPLTTSNKWRWVYYRQPKDLLNDTDNANLIIPEEYHLSLVNATCRILDYQTHQEPYTFNDIESYFYDFWNDLRQINVDTGDCLGTYSAGNLP